MNKSEFACALEGLLPGMPKQELADRIGFYMEMIDDRIEEGLSEEDAVAEIGTVSDIAAEIIAETPLFAIAKEKIKPKRKLGALEITLIALGSPVWVALLVSALAVILSLLAAVAAIAISLIAADAVLAVSPIWGALIAVSGFATGGSLASGIAIFGVSFVAAGISVFLFYGIVYTMRATLSAVKAGIFGIKKIFVGREAT